MSEKLCLLIVCACLLVCAAAGQAAHHETEDPNAPLAYLTLDAADIVAVDPNDANSPVVAVDVTGNGYDADLTGQTSAPGAVGEALVFDGSDFITLVDSNSLPVNNADNTVMLWLNTTEEVAQMQVLTHNPASGEHRAQDRALVLNTKTGGSKFGEFPGVAFVDHGGVGFVAGSTIVTDGEWHHVAYTVDHELNGEGFDVETIILYVDGMADGNEVWTESASWALGSSVDNLVNLGGGSESNWFPDMYIGMLDDVKIIGKTLSAEEILAASGIVPLPAAYAHWKFDETEGTVAADATGNGHDGTIMNTPVWEAGILGGALRCKGGGGSGIDGSVFMGELPGFTTSNCTVSGWMRNTWHIDTWQWPLGDQVNSFTLGATKKGTAEEPQHLIVNWGPGGGWDHDTGLDVTLNEWHFVSVVVSPNEITVGMDGVYNTREGNFTDVVITDWQLGNGKAAWAGFFGYLDDWRLYNEALTPEELAMVRIGR